MAYSVEHVVLIENLYRLMNSGAKTYYRISLQRLNGFVCELVVTKNEKRWLHD